MLLSQIVNLLDEHIIGQSDAKKAVAVALRLLGLGGQSCVGLQKTDFLDKSSSIFPRFFGTEVKP